MWLWWVVREQCVQPDTPDYVNSFDKTFWCKKRNKGKTETSNAGNIDLKQFGIEQNPSASPITGKEDYSKYFQTSKTTTTSGPIDLKQFGIEQNPSASPITGNEDYSKYFQTTKTTTTKTNGPVDLKQFRIDMIFFYLI